ncbi:fasciclin domain-containing protein [Euzebya rosea]|uniref:fasciclin domain-containing protein n=1 Tax=Euzebya rosea TaxID=2052804 RepID=UPI000D3E0B52|nr:fasciclin domain-containing protein [Euzebya rosea]
MSPTPHPRLRLILLVGMVLLAACSSPAETPLQPAGTAVVDSTTVCTTEGVESAIALADEDGSREAMAEVPVITAAMANPVLSRAVAAAATAKLTDTLENAEAVTVFAPTDCAFEMLDPELRDAALADPAGLLTQILGAHIVPGERLGSAELTGGELTTFTGRTIPYTREGDRIVLAGQATVQVADIQTANATIHLVDHVIVPDGVQGPVQVEAVETGPPDSTTACDTAALTAAINAGPVDGTIVGMADDPVAVAASSNPVLTTLVEAIVGADLVDSLNSADALTVFAPTDCAFAMLDPSTLQAAMADPDGLLARILQFHVVPGRLTFDQLDGGELPTAAGPRLPYTVEDNVVTLNGQARIVVPNIQTANATVHLIDRVLLPAG